MFILDFKLSNPVNDRVKRCRRSHRGVGFFGVRMIIAVDFPQIELVVEYEGIVGLPEPARRDADRDDGDLQPGIRRETIGARPPDPAKEPRA